MLRVYETSRLLHVKGPFQQLPRVVNKWPVVRQNYFLPDSATSGSQKCLALVKNLYSISDLVALISLHSEVIFKVKVFKFKDTQWSDYPI